MIQSSKVMNVIQTVHGTKVKSGHLTTQREPSEHFYFCLLLKKIIFYKFCVVLNKKNHSFRVCESSLNISYTHQMTLN